MLPIEGKIIWTVLVLIGGFLVSRVKLNTSIENRNDLQKMIYTEEGRLIKQIRIFTFLWFSFLIALAWLI